ncbi:MAG: hypothetical protein ACFFCS_28610 [Candidatus Hodarchaeota archaeon]
MGNPRSNTPDWEYIIACELELMGALLHSFTILVKNEKINLEIIKNRIQSNYNYNKLEASL